MENSNILGTEKISKLMFKFSVPCILSLLIGALYNIVDQIFIGNSELSTLGNAATGAVFPIFIVAQAFAWCFGDGCAAYLNICQGKKDTASAHKAIGTGITVTLFSAFVLMAIFYPLKMRLLPVFGASENSIGMAVEYFDIILAFFPAYMLSNMINSVVRSDGSPTWAMIAMLIGAATNLILDPIFIFGFHWGMKGAAFATVIGQVISFVLSALYLFKTKTFKLSAKSFIPDFKAFSGALKLGISTFVTQMTILVISVTCNIFLSKYGALSVYGVDIPIAVIGIESKVFTVVINIVVGIILGCQPIIGYNMGAQKYDYWIFAEKLFRIFLSLITFTCVVKMSSIFFQAVGKPVYAIVTSIIRDIVFFVPLVIILPKFFGIDGILYAAPISDIVAMAVTVVLTVVYMRKLKAYM